MHWADDIPTSDQFESEDLSDSGDLSDSEYLGRERIPKQKKISAKPINIPPKSELEKSDLNGKILIGRRNQWKKPIQFVKIPEEEKNQGAILKKIAMENIAEQKEFKRIRQQKNRLLEKIKNLARENMLLAKKRLKREKEDLERVKFHLEQLENENKKLKESDKSEELEKNNVFSLFEFEPFGTIENTINKVNETKSVVPKKIVSLENQNDTTKRTIPKKILSLENQNDTTKRTIPKHQKLFHDLKKHCKEMDCKHGEGKFIRITPKSKILDSVSGTIYNYDNNEDVKKFVYRLIEIIECCEEYNLIPSFAFTLNMGLLNQISLLFWDEANSKLIGDNFQKILKSLSFNTRAGYHWGDLLELIENCNLRNLEIYLTPALLTALKNWDIYWRIQLLDLYRKIKEGKIIFLNVKGEKILLPKIEELVKAQKNFFEN